MTQYNFYLDFQKAFDRVPHEELLFKLSILGPICFFLVYINDLPNFSSIHIFADDTKRSHQMKSTSDTIELQWLNEWSNKWNLSFNSQKCVLMKFSKNSHSL